MKKSLDCHSICLDQCDRLNVPELEILQVYFFRPLNFVTNLFFAICVVICTVLYFFLSLNSRLKYGRMPVGNYAVTMNYRNKVNKSWQRGTKYQNSLLTIQ